MSLTKKLKLRSGIPVWTSYPLKAVRARPLRKNVSTEVLVVGAGISGALVAHALTRQGHRVTVVDRRGAVQGSTLASTALLQFEIDLPLSHLARKIGKRPAERAWLRSKRALDHLGALIRTERIHAGLSSKPSLYLAGSILDADGLRREDRARSRIGLPSEYLSRAALRRRFDIRREAAIVSSSNLALDPRALTSGLLRRACRGGASLLAPVEIVDVQTGRREVLVATKQGFDIKARHVVFCTGYELLKLIPVGGHTIGSTWVIATRPQPTRLWPEECLIWEAADPYLYARTTRDGRVICGGEDASFSDEAHRDTLIGAKAATLERKLAQLLPRLNTCAEFRWAGSFGQSSTGLPSIGSVPGYRNCYAVLGYGGNGITFSMMAAELLSAAIHRKRDPDAAIFAFR